MNAEFFEALDKIQEERGVSKAYMLEKIKAAIASSVKREKQVPADCVDVVFDEKDKELRVFIKKTVVEEVSYPATEISLEEALSIDVAYRVGDSVPIAFDPQSVGRIAAKIGKNVIIQAINEAVNGSLIQEFERMRGSIISGTVSRRDERGHCIYVEIMGYEMQMAEKDLIPGEIYKEGDRIKVCVADIRKNAKSQEIVLSRSCPDFLKALFEIEIPEITDGVVAVKSIAREAGSRSKVAVFSTDPNVDAIGSCIGARQARISAILAELSGKCDENGAGERIDLIPYTEDPSEYVVASIAPAKGRILEIAPDQRQCKIVVPADQQSLAIGRNGQNVRLAAKLTGYRIDILAE